MWNATSGILNWITQPVSHFLLAFAAGSLACLLIMTIFFALLKWASPSYLSKEYMVASYGTLILSLLVGLSVGLLSHGYLDSFSTWLTTPLNPPIIY